MSSLRFWCLLGISWLAFADDIQFVVKPYIQLGDKPRPSSKESASILWHDSDQDTKWRVRARSQGEQKWIEAKISHRRVEVVGVEPHRVYTASIGGLKPGAEFDYEVLQGEAVAFGAKSRARRARGEPHRFVVFGDCAQGTPGQKEIAYQTYLAKPDYVLITGDIVYSRGLISEYREKYFPVYNAETASPQTGAPLIRSTLFIGAPGNHDIAVGDLDKFPDGLAYFFNWAQPLNGPISTPGAPYTPPLQGAEDSLKKYLKTAGNNYPRMANFSFDYGDVHWTVLDSNDYTDWTNADLKAWVENDLKSARKAAWRFVAFHHPGFNSSKAHFNEQKMRVLSEVFEKGKVSIVFTGHVHNYQRAYPLKFKVTRQPDGRPYKPNRNVDGVWTLDKNFDGEKNTQPDGVIYLVTGGGGARLYNPEQQRAPETWQEFTVKFVSEVHSLTVVDVNPSNVQVRQLAADGTEIDRFIVTAGK